MKKSFMTRVLATGLSLAMAFSLSAATNVSVASAATKQPAMKSSSFKVRVGNGAKLYSATAATKKAYKITKATPGNPDKATVTVTSKGGGIKVKAGTVTGSTVIKVTFKNKTTKATTKKSYRCYVLPEKTDEEVSTELTMTAAATGVKQITVTFNQTVDTTVTDTIAVAKDSASPTFTATPSADATSVVLAMDAKLTAGTYTVSVTSGETTLTADITVADETLTSFALVSENLVADATNTTGASIYFNALNQYGEMMAATSATATCSFGTTEVASQPGVDESGKITVADIPSTLAIDGTTGTLVIVDTTNGVSLTATVTYRPKAVASVATVAGIYNEKTEALIDGNLTVGTNVANYAILVNIQDQYGNDMTVDGIDKSRCKVTLNPASVLTDLSTGSEVDSQTCSDILLDGTNYIAIALTATSNTIKTSGTLTLTMVSTNKGILATPSFTVDNQILISSFSVSASGKIYNDGGTYDLVVDAVDTEGNSVTSYDDLYTAFKNTFDKNNIYLYKNPDGTGTFKYVPDVTISSSSETAYGIDTVVFYANPTTSGNYIVKTVSFNVYTAQITKAVGAFTGSINAAAQLAGAFIPLSSYSFTVVDQYSNSYSNVGAMGQSADVYVSLSDSKGIFEKLDKNTLENVSELKVSAVGAETTGTATLYVKYGSEASASNYDIKVTFSVIDLTSLSADDLSVTINGGNTIYGAESITLVPSTTSYAQKDEGSNASALSTTGAAIYIEGTVGSKTAIVPTSYITPVTVSVGGYGYADTSFAPYGTIASDYSTVGATTETVTVTIAVESSASSTGTVKVTQDVTVSNAAGAFAGMYYNNTAETTGNEISSDELTKTLCAYDQYGFTFTLSSGSVIFTITPIGKNASDLKVSKNETQYASIKNTGSESSYSAFVYYEYGTYTTSATVTLNYNVETN